MFGCLVRILMVEKLAIFGERISKGSSSCTRDLPDRVSSVQKPP